MLQEIQEFLVIKLAFQGTTTIVNITGHTRNSHYKAGISKHYRIFFSNMLRCVRVYEILVYHTVTSWRYILGSTEFRPYSTDLVYILE